MIRFIDLRSALDVFERFAYFDTVTDKFVEVGGSQTFSDWGDFEGCARGEGVDIPRFKSLTPSWAFESACAPRGRRLRRNTPRRKPFGCYVGDERRVTFVPFVREHGDGQYKWFDVGYTIEVKDVPQPFQESPYK